MDELVKQALAKWPNVPHCYGWLGLDARGHWRMRDQQAQQQQLPGDKIAHAALLNFINRNYDHDDRGCWFFQNGPQRVYVNLEATPYIARSDPQHGFVLQTGAPLEQIEQVYWCDNGMLILRQGDVVAQVDDRDMAHVLPSLRVDGQVASDEATPDQTELSEVRWFTKPEARDLLAGKIQGTFAPGAMAIAHQLLKAWAESED